VLDIKPYLRFLGIDSIENIKIYIKEQLDREEEDYSVDYEQPPSLRLIRIRVIYYKFFKIVGAFSPLNKDEKLRLVNQIV
jgi:hypothetical protein